MSNITFEYSSVINLIREEMELTRREFPDFANLKLIIEDERLLAKSKDRSPDTIYIQIKFGAASTNFGQAVLPFSMEVIGINQDVELTQDLLNKFVNEFNQMQVGDITQYYLTPVISMNNIPIYEGYRSMFIVSSTFIISNKLIRLSSLKYKIGENEYEDIEFIAYNDASEADLNPQPLPNTGGRSKSYGSFQTFAFNIVTYPDSNKQLIKDIFDWKFNTNQSNRTFILSGSFSNITSGFTDWEFKCKSVETIQKIGEQPTISIAFTL